MSFEKVLQNLKAKYFETKHSRPCQKHGCEFYVNLIAVGQAINYFHSNSRSLQSCSKRTLLTSLVSIGLVLERGAYVFTAGYLFTN